MAAAARQQALDATLEKPLDFEPPAACGMRIVKSAIPDNIQVTKEAVPLRIVASDVASFGAGFPGKVNKEALEALREHLAGGRAG